jgi:hypothetical protein
MTQRNGHDQPEMTEICHTYALPGVAGVGRQYLNIVSPNVQPPFEPPSGPFRLAHSGKGNIDAIEASGITGGDDKIKRTAVSGSVHPVQGPRSRGHQIGCPHHIIEAPR